MPQLNDGPKLLLSVSAEENGSRLDHFLKRQLSQVSFTLVAKLIRKGVIRLNNKRTQISGRLETGQTVSIPRSVMMAQQESAPETSFVPLTKEQRQDIRNWTIYEDEDILVLNKPQGVAVQGGTHQLHPLIDRLIAYYRGTGITPRLVHRLDKETTGILVVAKNLSTTKFLTRAFKNHEVKKTYWALTEGAMKMQKGKHKSLLPGKHEGESLEAETHFLTLGHSPHVSLVELNPLTGRTHQLRLHLKEMGTPVLGDTKYGKARTFLKTLGLPRALYLHAHDLTIPREGAKKMSFHAPLPPHFERAMDDLGLRVNAN